jgi:hypothetical protein
MAISQSRRAAGNRVETLLGEGHAEFQPAVHVELLGKWTPGITPR